jgi:hypothetical protein
MGAFLPLSIMCLEHLGVFVVEPIAYYQDKTKIYKGDENNINWKRGE